MVGDSRGGEGKGNGRGKEGCGPEGSGDWKAHGVALPCTPCGSWQEAALVLHADVYEVGDSCDTSASSAKRCEGYEKLMLVNFYLVKVRRGSTCMCMGRSCHCSRWVATPLPPPAACAAVPLPPLQP
eukprot:183322-Chlamydomonas_euryale.AAC.4